MEIERVITNTERSIIRKRMAKGITSHQVYSCCEIKKISEVYKQCGGKSVILYLAIVGNEAVNNTGNPGKLMDSFISATGFNKTELSRATSKLEDAEFIIVKRQSGKKNQFKLRDKK